MKTNPLVNFIKAKPKREADLHLQNYLEYVTNLEEEVTKLRDIVNNPDAEIARLKEENHELYHRMKIAENYGFTSSNRATAELWTKCHYESNHPDTLYQDYSFVITPTPFDSVYECRCNKCGVTQEI